MLPMPLPICRAPLSGQEAAASLTVAVCVPAQLLEDDLSTESVAIEASSRADLSFGPRVQAHFRRRPEPTAPAAEEEAR